MADPFADAGFTPRIAPAVSEATTSAQIDPFAAAGMVPTALTPSPPQATADTTVPGGGDNPVFSDSMTGAPMVEGQNRANEKLLEGATFGMWPYASAAMKWVGGTPFSQGLQEARDYTAQSSKELPVPSAIMEGAGSLIPTLGTFGALNPAENVVARAIPYAGRPLAQALIGGTLGGASAAGQDVGAGTTQNLGSDVKSGATTGAILGGAAPVVGSVLQAVPNVAQSGVAALSNIVTGGGRDAVAGQIAREVSGDFANTAARSPLPDLTLRTAQATGNPGIAGLDRTLASTPGAQAASAGDLVANGRTPNQMGALARALVGTNASIEPAVLTNQASARGVQAINGVDAALADVEKQKWSTPALQAVGTTLPGFNGPAIAGGVAQDVAQFPASWRNAVTGPQNTLGPFLDELHELGPSATVPEINSVRSRLLGVARDAASGPTPDAVTAAAANRMAGSITDRMANDPALAGEPATVTPIKYETAIGPDGQPVSVKTGGMRMPAGAPNTAAQNDYQAARDFTRQYRTAVGYPEFDSILNPNAAGNVAGNAEKQFGQFFDLAGGTNAGLQRLQTVADLARNVGAAPQASELQGAAQDYMRSAVLRTARGRNGLDATGAPMISPATLASTINRAMPAISGTPMTAPIAGDVQAAGNAAELLNRPSTLRGDANSTTFEKLRNRDLVSALVGQSGSSALGAAAGGYVAGEHGPDAVPWYLRVPGGMLAGAMLGQRVGPSLGSAVAHTPVLKGLVEGPASDIERRLAGGLADPAEWQRLLATQMATGPRIGAPGAVSAFVPRAAQAAIPAISGGGTR